MDSPPPPESIELGEELPVHRKFVLVVAGGGLLGGLFLGRSAGGLLLLVGVGLRDSATGVVGSSWSAGLLGVGVGRGGQGPRLLPLTGLLATGRWLRLLQGRRLCELLLQQLNLIGHVHHLLLHGIGAGMRRGGAVAP